MVRSDELFLRTFSSEYLVLAVGPSHRLHGKKRVELADLAEESFVGLTPNSDSSFEHLIAVACQNAGFVPRVAVSARDILSVIALAASGAGVALVPSSMRRLAGDNLGFVEVVQQKSRSHFPVALAYSRKNGNPAIPLLLAVADKVRDVAQAAPR
jgi:DNA-binding transcriptional LysR family regulator